jgi:DNA-binding NarL/FixJ family response regulator
MISLVDLIPARVLIIEKHPLMREALCAAISDEPDLSVEMKAFNGREALEMLGVILPDIILLAMGNPGSDELETLKIIRESVPQTPILALTSSEVPGQEQAARNTGAHAVLTKAATRAELIGKLREIINDSGVHLVKDKNEKYLHSCVLPQRTTGKPVC